MIADRTIDPEKSKACREAHSGMSQKPIWKDLGRVLAHRD